MTERTATCGCGNLTARVQGEPIQVYACSCLNCQREGGGAFTYSAVFPETAVSVAGERQAWGRKGDSGSSVQTEFCPTCGTTLLARLEAWPDVVMVSAGCFTDPGFAAPETLYWASRHHHWLTFPESTERLDSQ